MSTFSSAAECTYSLILYVCLQELNVLQVNTEGKLKVLETDLQAAKDTVKALKERNKDLGKIKHQQMRQKSFPMC